MKKRDLSKTDLIKGQVNIYSTKSFPMQGKQAACKAGTWFLKWCLEYLVQYLPSIYRCLMPLREPGAIKRGIMCIMSNTLNTGICLAFMPHNNNDLQSCSVQPIENLLPFIARLMEYMPCRPLTHGPISLIYNRLLTKTILGMRSILWWLWMNDDIFHQHMKHFFPCWQSIIQRTMA